MRCLSILTYFVLIWIFCHSEAMAESAKVSIQKYDDRTEALVTVTGISDESLDSKNSAVQETFEAIEDGTLDVMGTSHELVARGTDQTVETVQSVGHSAFSWFFRALDFQKENSEQKTTQSP